MAASSIYIVDAQEESVVLRFGEYQRTTGPGFNLKLPTPIETRITRKTREVQKVNIGGSSANSLMLTGDENIVDIDFTVLWRIDSLENHLFEVDDPRNAVTAVAKSAMREIVGKSALEKIITTDRFRLIVKEYKAAPRVTRERMYLETLEEVYKDAEKIVLDEGAGGGVVPYLSLNELTGKKAPQR